MTDKRFYEALVADSSECFRKYGLDLPKELSELITYGRLREDGHIHSVLIRISSVLASILSQMMSSCTRSALKYEKPLIFSLPISKEIYDETTLNLGGSG